MNGCGPYGHVAEVHFNKTGGVDKHCTKASYGTKE